MHSIPRWDEGSSNPRGKIMTTPARANSTFLWTKRTTFAALAALAVMISVTAGVVAALPSSDPAWNAATQLTRPPVAAVYAKDRPQSQPRNEDIHGVGMRHGSCCEFSMEMMIQAFR
jgi:hypothetical protein